MNIVRVLLLCGLEYCWWAYIKFIPSLVQISAKFWRVLRKSKSFGLNFDLVHQRHIGTLVFEISGTE